MRGIAAWFVVLFHLRLALDWLPPMVIAVFAKGYLAVDFFFLLSGFVIWLSWHDRLRAGGMRAVPAFLWRRLARIYPLHLVTLGATVALAVLLAAAGRHDAAHYPFAELPLHVLLLQTWGFTDRLAWNDPSWSISTEWAAYLVFPFVAFGLDWRRVPSWAVLAAIAALLVLLAVAMGPADNLGNAIPTLGLRRCLLEFTAGGAICALWLRWRDRPVRPAALAALATLALLIAWRAGMPETLAVPAAFAAGLLALALTSDWRGNPLATPALHYLGEVSYATYLGHFLLFVLFKLALVDDPRAIPPLLIALYLALVFGSSVALHHLVERPAQDWMNRLPARLRRTGRTGQAASSSI
uniref:acyltransferase family protein n=1 Tax=uncultured Sphingomonas sp. TaxID=158754 RepID=UPI0035CC7A92